MFKPGFFNPDFNPWTDKSNILCVTGTVTLALIGTLAPLPVMFIPPLTITIAISAFFLGILIGSFLGVLLLKLSIKTAVPDSYMYGKSLRISAD